MKTAFDSNILIHAFDPSEAEKHERARQLVYKLITSGAVVPLQVLGEALNAAHKKRVLDLEAAREACAIIQRRCMPEAATDKDLFEASELAEQFRLQFFDALICVVSRRLGATVLFSEDMHDGLHLGSLKIVNPFREANAELVAAALG